MAAVGGGRADPPPDTLPGGQSSWGELIAKIGTIVSAIMASSCCWLPLLLLAVGVSGAGIATALEAYRPIFIVVTFGFLATAFYFTYRPRRMVHVATAGAAALDTSHSDCCAPASAFGADGSQRTEIPAEMRRRRFSMMAFNKGMLWVVTVLAVVFLFFPQYLTALLGGGNDEITRDMTRTVVRVTGMTCDG